MKYLKSLIVVIAGLLLMGMRRSVWRLRTAGEPGDTTSNSRADDSEGQLVDGPDADSPADITVTGWKAALKRTKQALKDKQLSTQAAGLAYYATLTFFPVLLGAATITASFTSPENLLTYVEKLKGLLPAAIYDLIHQQITPLANARPVSLGIAAAASIAALLWTTSGGLQNLIKATNIAYEAPETRNFVKLRLVSLVLSGVLLLLGGAIMVTLLLDNGALHQLGMPDAVADIFPIIRWPILIVLISLILSVIYRYAPNRKAPRWSWVSWGATAATIIWLLGTVLFFLYAQRFGNFNKTYGIFAGMIILMTWFNLSSLIVLVGAQVNRKLEEISQG